MIFHLLKQKQRVNQLISRSERFRTTVKITMILKLALLPILAHPLGLTRLLMLMTGCIPPDCICKRNSVYVVDLVSIVGKI